MRVWFFFLAAATASVAFAQPTYESPPIVPHAGLARGDWPDRLELDVPPGPGGFAPSVAIVASHLSSDGVLGMGFQLEVGGVIERRSASGGVPVSADKNHLLDGARLYFEKGILTGGGGPNDVDEYYRSELDTGAEARYHGVTNTWTVSKDGWTYQYGSTTGTGIEATKRRGAFTPSPTTSGREDGIDFCDRCNTFAWYLSKATDPWGNTVIYDYRVGALPSAVASIYQQPDSGQHLLSVIQWTSVSGTALGKINFDYAARPDLQIDFSSGLSTVSGHRLTAIRVYAGTSTAYSRYAFEYLDQNGRDCDGNPMGLTDPSDLRNLIGEGPLRTLLRRITRVDVDDLSRSRVMRCLQTNHERTQSSSWATPVYLPTILPPRGAFEIGAKVIPIAANFNGDGRSDLVVLTVNKGLVDHDVYLSRASGRDLLVAATSSDLGGGSYQLQFSSSLTAAHLEGGRGWFIGDLDRDSYPDFIYEVDTADVGSVQMARYQPTTNFFEFTLPRLGACRLRASVSADIDGDGFLDLVRRPNAESNGCNASKRTQWLRNLGKAPWFDEGDRGENWQALALPLADPAAAGISVVLPDLLKSWTLEQYVSNQSRFGDFNGDGIADIAYAFHRSWTTPAPDPSCIPDLRNPCLPLKQVPFSRIYFGTGYGTFVDSRLGAGAPLLNYVGPDDAPESYYTGLLETHDLDRSGHAELLTTVEKNGYPAAIVAHWRGISHGFSGPDSTIPVVGQGSGVLEEMRLGFEDYPDAGSDCHNRAYWPTLADFDGDGFTDILNISWFPGRSSAFLPCEGHEWCANYELSSRAYVEGRLLKSDGVWGGRTVLGWGFTGDTTLNGFNTDLPFSSEVLTSVDGADGPTTLRYARGTQVSGLGKGFGLVERQNARGGVDVFVQATTPPLHARPVYSARYRNTGGLEKVSVFVHGHLTDDLLGYRIDASTPFFNPLLRRCEYEVEEPSTGETAPTIEALISACWSYGGRRAPSAEHLWAAFGIDRYPAPGPVADAAAIMWGERASITGWLELNDTTGPGMISNLWGIDSRPLFRSVGWRWEPSDVPLPTVPGVETFLADVPAVARGRDYKQYVTDFTFADPNLHRATQVWLHRDTTIREDDLKIDYEWQPAGAGPSYRMVKSTTSGEGPIVYATSTRTSFVGFDVAGEEQTCGEAGQGCRTELSTYSADGSILTRELKESAEKELWTRTAWCAQETYLDAAGRKSESVFDSRCRRTEHTWRGVVEKATYDGFNREITSSRVVNGGETSHAQLTYDDVFDKREDKKFTEPRETTSTDGALELQYRDGFGRATRRVTCDSKPQQGAAPSCKQGTEVVQEWNLYGVDGLVKATSSPFVPAVETPVLSTVSYRDGLGRALLTQRPAPVDLSKGGAAWVNESSWWAPGRNIVRDAMGRLRVDSATSLSQQSEFSGERFSRVDYDAFSRVTRTDDVNNGAAKYSYDSEHRVAAIVREAKAESVDAEGQSSPQPFKRSVEYDRYGYQRRVIEPDGTSTQTENDVLGQPLRQLHLRPDGTQALLAQFSYSIEPNGTTRVSKTDEQGAVTEEIFDGLDRTVSRRWPNGSSLLRTFEPAQRRVRELHDDGGLKLETVYEGDVHGHLKTVITPQGRLSFTVDGAGRTLSLTGVDGSIQRKSYLFAGVLNEERLDARKGSWLLYRANYANDLRPTRVWADGGLHDYQYDEFGRLKTKTSGGASKLSEITYGYQGLSDRVELLSRRSPGFGPADTRFTYDAWGRMTSRTNPEPGTVTYSYDVMGRPRFVEDEVGSRRESRYDTRGRLIRGDIPGWGAVEIAYTAADTYAFRYSPGSQATHLLRVDQKNAGGAVRSTWTDSMGRTIALRAADGSGVEKLFAGSRVSHRIDLPNDASAALHTYLEYDRKGDVTALYGPTSSAEAFNPEKFDGYRILLRRGAGGRVESIDAAGERTAFTYDEKSGLPLEEHYRGLVRRVQYADPMQPDMFPRIQAEELVGRRGGIRRSVYQFNGLGQLTREEVEDGQRRRVNRWGKFDPWGLATFDERSSGPLAGPLVAEVAQQWTRDLRGQPLNRELFVSGKKTGDTSWTWSANGQLASEKGPGGRTLVYEYADSRITKIRTAEDNVVQAAVTARDTMSRPTSIDLGTGKVELEWQRDGRLRERRHLSETGRIVSRWTPTYDGFGRISAENIQSGAQTFSNTYQYDAASRLIGESRGRSAQPVNYAYQLNSAGGRVQTLRDGVQTTRVEYDPAFPLERVTAVNGTALVHDEWDGVMKDQHGIEYGYGADGSLSTAAKAGTATYRFLREASGLPVLTLQDQGASRVTTWRLDPARSPLQINTSDGLTLSYLEIEGLLLRRLTGSKAADYFTNASGTPLSIGGADLADLTSFGEGTPTAGDEALLWAGMETLPALPQIRLARHRVFDPATGRFLRPDPIGLEGGVHRTGYADGDPVGRVDPLGLWACPSVGTTNEPKLNFNGLLNPGHFQVAPPSFGSGNATHDSMMIQLAAGLEAKSAPNWDFDLSVSSPFAPDSPCALKCNPPGEETSKGGGPSAFPVAPAPTAAKGSKADRFERKFRKWSEARQTKWQNKQLVRAKKEELRALKKDSSFSLARIGEKILDNPFDFSALSAFVSRALSCKGACTGKKLFAYNFLMGALLPDPPDDTPGDPPPPPQPPPADVPDFKPEHWGWFLPSQDAVVVYGNDLKVPLWIPVPPPPAPPKVKAAPPQPAPSNEPIVWTGEIGLDDDEEGDPIDDWTQQIKAKAKAGGCTGLGTSKVECSISIFSAGNEAIGVSVDLEVDETGAWFVLTGQLIVGGEIRVPAKMCKDCNDPFFGGPESETEDPYDELWNTIQEEAQRQQEEAGEDTPEDTGEGPQK
jgi:RHS repeat-associated protein